MANLDREIDLMLERSQRRYECLDQQIDLMLEGSLEEASSRKATKPQLPAVTQTTKPQLPAVTQKQKEEVVRYLYDAAGILTMRAIKTKEAVNFIDKFGQILKKYFLSRRVLRTVKEKQETTLEEELAMIENSKGAGSQKSPNVPPVTGKQESSILMDLTDYVAVDPKVAKASLATLERKYKDLIKAHKDEVKNNSDYKIRFRGLRYLILRAAGLAAKEISTPTELKENKSAKIVIDLEMLKRKQLNEGLLGMFGAWIEFFLNGLFGGWTPPISVTGNKRDVEAFARAVHGEKSYIEAVRKYGLDHPTTYKNKAKLDNSIKGFEKDTGIKWPFK